MISPSRVGEVGLTMDFAEKIKLPLNPIARHKLVRHCLTDPELLGGVEVRINPGEVTTIDPLDVRPVVVVHTVLPLLGRRNLRSMATTLKFIKDQEIIRKGRI